MTKRMERLRYDSLNGLRAISCIGIILMHIAANNDYNISGFLYNKVIPSFTDFVYLFMMLSAFGMCCGYYKKMLTNSVDLAEFYKKRYLKILPFFALLVFLELILSFSKTALCEAIADLTLMFGLFPNDISVIGVGWFLGLIFAFYMIFPFYCVLIKTKASAWLFFAISLLMNVICGAYFQVGRKNIVFALCYFIGGGLIYLYRQRIERIHWKISLPLLLLSILLYYLVGTNTLTILLVSTFFIIFAIGKGGKLLNNKVFGFISGISLEMYLSHMLVFRALEIVHLNTKLGDGVIQYLFTCILVIVLDIAFAFLSQKVIARCFTFIRNKKSH